MHYYKFNISDWALSTSHLSEIEELVYFRLMNFYYDTEKPIPKETHSVIRRLRLGSHSETVALILSEFFNETENGWEHDRINEVIENYHETAEKNKKNGKKGGRPRINKGQKPNGLPVESQDKPKDNPNYKPLTINQEPKTKEDSAPDNSAAEYVLEYMNGVLNSKYKKTTKTHIENINARLNEGHTVEELKRVIDSKHAQWSNDPQMAAYLRPQTLFQAGKFQGYLTAANVKTKANGHNLSGKVYESGDL